MRIDEKYIERTAKRIASDIRSAASRHQETSGGEMRRSVSEKDIRILNRVKELLEQDIRGSIYVCSANGPVVFIIEST